MPRTFAAVIAIAGLFCCPFANSADHAPIRSEPTRKETARWCLIYHIPGDNDLNPHTASVLKQLAEGPETPGVAVVAQIDRADYFGMERRIVRREKSNPPPETFLVRSEEDSACEKTLAEFLLWTAEHVPAQNYAVFILGHGGKLNEMCEDWNPDPLRIMPPGEGTLEKWMPADRAAEACASFHAATGNRVRFLMLQQCGRASLEILYPFREAAELLIASQLIVGAPNRYYGSMFKRFAEAPESDPIDIVDAIIQNDSDAFAYSVVDAREFENFPRRFGELAKSLEHASLSRKPIKMTFKYQAERFFDFQSFLLSLQWEGAQREENEARRNSFLEWMNGKLIVRRWTSAAYGQELSGLNLFIPANREQRQRYHTLPFYRDTPMITVFETLGIGNAEAAP
jgi:hypothetical protein